MAAGYDVYSIHKYTLKPSATTKIPLGITIKPPKGSYIQLQSRNGLASKGVIVYAGTIDPDYSGLTTYHVQPGEQIP
jgi:dUTPase